MRTFRRCDKVFITPFPANFSRVSLVNDVCRFRRKCRKLRLCMISGDVNNPAQALIQGRKGGRRFFEFDSLNRAYSKNVTAEEFTLIKFILDFTNRHRWDQVVVFVSNSSKFSNSLPPVLFNFFNADGKFVGVHTTSKPLLPQSMQHNRHVLGVVYLCDVVDEDFLEKVSDFDFFDSYRSWLIVKIENATNKLEEILASLNIALVTNLVIASFKRKSTATTVASSPQPATSASTFVVGYRKRQVGSRIKRLERDYAGDPNLIAQLTQVYKCSAGTNDTISIKLGTWDVPNGMLKAKFPSNAEQRWDMGGFRISVGMKNSSHGVEGALTLDRFSFDNEIEEESRFLELSDCLLRGLNASFEAIQFQKLGWRNEEGGWTHLLGAVVDGTVDFALETINPNVDKSRDMTFTYAIVISMNNIYFRRPKAGGLRDIFLAPFSPRLLLCVFSTSLLLAIAMISITIANYHSAEAKKASSEFQIFTRGKRERSVVITNNGQRKWEVSEAVLWSVSVLCMQGSQWSPKSLSGSLLLINSLLFALIIYNSFAAFITSVLSVKDVKIKDLKDLANSDFGFGYTLGDADELFLRTVNDTLLRELYFKGLRENDGVSSSIEGMQRAAKGKYAFFVGARTARRALRSIIAHDKRCEFQELYLPVTKTYASIPVARKSYLRKILNYKIIRLMETGILHRFQRLILPSMPRCVEKTTFNSARLTDVYSAFFLLAVGQVASIVILFVEILWNKKTNMQRRILNENYKLTGVRTGNEGHWLR